MYSKINAPSIFTLASYDTVYWPYKTDGHYTNLVGYSNPNRDNPDPARNSYYIVDPYYFPKYGHGIYADGKFTRSFTPVSYTHLDVYKRQLLGGFRQSLFCSKPCRPDTRAAGGDR